MAKKTNKKKNKKKHGKTSGKTPPKSSYGLATSGSKSDKPEPKGGKASAKSDKQGAKKEPDTDEPAPASRGLLIYLLPPLLIVGIYLGLANWMGWTRGADAKPIAGTESTAAVDGDALVEIPQVLAAALGKEVKGAKVASARLREKNQALYLAFRKGGKLVRDGWISKGTVREGMASLAQTLAKSGENVRAADTAEICMVHSFRPVEPGHRSSFGNIFRGVRGLELDSVKGVRRISPTTMLAQNFKFKRALQFLAKEEGLKAADISNESLRTFECDQVLVFLGEQRAVSMYRGNEVVPLNSVNRASTNKFLDGMIRWLTFHVQPNGRMTYKWWPSQGKEAQSNNMIRQWMATAALAQIGHDRKADHVFDLAEKNIDYNLARFYQQDAQGHGYILYNKKAKLGAMALAAFSIYLHPKRDKWASQEAAILKTINSLLQKNGRYTTFFLPKGRNDNENFYPGETQLYLATRYVDEKDPAMLERIMRAFRFYRKWHRDNRNPAFIPWHTQAYFTLWEVTKEQELVDFVFEMNDWLVDTMLQWKTAKTPDAKGRFYNPNRRYGPPHASSTGVYLEGLIDAYKLARELGDDTRRKRYARAMVRGLRSSMQLQFEDDVDMFYISKKDQSRGGMRTTVYDNVIRVDNVQHTLMGVLKIVRELSDEDWAYGIAED